MGIPKHLLHKRMTRKEFLQLTGGSLLVLFGLSNFLRFLNQFSEPPARPKLIAKQEASHGFGTRKFGA